MKNYFVSQETLQGFKTLLQIKYQYNGNVKTFHPNLSLTKIYYDNFEEF